MIQIKEIHSDKPNPLGVQNYGVYVDNELAAEFQCSSKSTVPSILIKAYGAVAEENWKVLVAKLERMHQNHP